MKVKKFFALALAFAIIFTFVGCGTESAPTSGTPDVESSGIDIDDFVRLFEQSVESEESQELLGLGKSRFETVEGEYLYAANITEKLGGTSILVMGHEDSTGNVEGVSITIDRKHISDPELMLCTTYVFVPLGLISEGAENLIYAIPDTLEKDGELNPQVIDGWFISGNVSGNNAYIHIIFVGSSGNLNPGQNSELADSENVDTLEREAIQILTDLGVTDIKDYHYLTSWAQGDKYRITGKMDGKSVDFDIVELNGRVKSIRIWENGNEAIFEANTQT